MVKENDSMSYNLSQIDSDARNDGTAKGIAKGYSMPDYGFAVSEDGRVKCRVIPCQAANGWTFRATWYLDGKKTSREAIEE